MLVTVEGFVLALAKVKKFNETKVIRTYVYYQSDFIKEDTFDKDIKEITINDVLSVDEYDVLTIDGYIEGDSEITEILQVFDWKVDIGDIL